MKLYVLKYPIPESEYYLCEVNNYDREAQESFVEIVFRSLTTLSKPNNKAKLMTFTSYEAAIEYNDSDYDVVELRA